MKKNLWLLILGITVVTFRAGALEVSDTVSLEAVTVTAIKGGSSIASASASTYIGEKEAERLRIESVKGATDVVPNFFVPDYGSRITSSIYVRGIGARIDQPSVGLTVDNVPFMNKDSYDFDLQDISSMQVVRGPQSTLYGRNTMAGVINITTLSPFEYQGLRASARYGRANTWRLGAGYYTRLNSSLGLSATLRGGGSDGFFTNQFTGKKCDDEHSVSARVKLQWHPSSSVTMINTFAASWLQQGGYPYEYVKTGQIAYNDTCSYRRTALNDGLTIRWRPGNVTFSSITSWQYLDDAMRLDQDFLPQDYFILLQAKRENALTQDFVASAEVGDWYSWIAGAFAFYRHLHMDAPVTFHDTGISELIEKHRNEANEYYPIRWKERSFLLNSTFSNPSYGVAVYHNSKFNLGDWILTAALRLDYEHASLAYNSHTSTAYEIFYRPEAVGPMTHYRDVPILIDEHGELSKSFLQLLPKVSATRRFYAGSATVEAYASIAKGYKSGGYNTQMFSDVLQQQLMWQMGIGKRYDVDDIVSYAPEQSWNYELGARVSTNDGRLRAEATLFYIDVKDQQLTMFPDGTTTGRIMTNAGRTRSYGLELSSRWNPVEVFELNASYGYTDARFRNFFNGKEQFRGKHIPYAPCNTFFVSGTYKCRLDYKSTLMFNANVRGNGRIYWNERNDVSQAFYACLGASIEYSTPKFSVQLWGENLTDTRYYTFYFVSMSNEFVQRGRPIDFGVTLNLYL